MDEDRNSTLIIGCGYVGMRLAKLLLKKGHRLYGTTRSPENAQFLRNHHIQPIIFDTLKKGSENPFPAVNDMVLSVAPGLRSGPPDEGIYEEGISRIMSIVRRNPPKNKLLYTSSVGVYSVSSGEWVDETTPIVATTSRQKALLAAEQSVFHLGRKALILRLGGIYGPGRNVLIRGQYKYLSLEDNEKFTNLIHVEDVTRGIFHLLKHGQGGEIYIGCDRSPARRGEIASWIEDKTGRTNIEKLKRRSGEKMRISNKRCRNRKLVDSGFQFYYPSFREGYEQILNDCRRGGHRG